MKLFNRFASRPLNTARILKRKHRYGLQKSMLKLKAGLAQEKAETRQMLVIYQQYLAGQAAPGQMKIANAQLVDLLKSLGLGVFAILPFSPITIPLLVKLGKLVGVDILPSAFSQSNEPVSMGVSQADIANIANIANIVDIADTNDVSKKEPNPQRFTR